MRISFFSLEKSLAQLVLRRLRGKSRQDKGEQYIQSSQLQGHRGRSVPLLLPQTVITKSKKIEKDPPRTIYGLKGVLFQGKHSWEIMKECLLIVPKMYPGVPLSRASRNSWEKQSFARCMHECACVLHSFLDLGHTLSRILA